MPANERMDWLVEKATELGVAALQPLLCERSVLRLDGERAERKREHWQAQAVAAAEQCGRTRVPVVQPVRRLADWLQHDGLPAHALAAQPAGRTSPVRPAPGQPLVCSAAPKAGCRPAEEDAARAAGFLAVQLGPRVLRAETAPLAVLAWLGLP
jgi:16S rRNA (uracil1498-N3)-methyltransferase